MLFRSSCDDWKDCNDGAKRYDLKLAGTHWVIKYPPGTGTVKGETKDNGEIAELLLAALESSGSLAIPTTTAQVLQEMINAEVANLYAWQVELLQDGGHKQESFGKRLKYLDNQKVRGLLMPERSLLEGEHGTKAEAGEHIGLMLTNMEAIDRSITRMFNQQLVNQLLQLNYGDELVDKVRLVSAPLVDTQISFLREIYKGMNDNDINVQALRDKLDVPTEIGGSEGLKKEEFLKEEEEEAKEPKGDLVWKTEEGVYKVPEKEQKKEEK